MDSRTSILNSVKEALRDVDKSKTVEPEVPFIWEVKGLSSEELAPIFAQNLQAVAGEAVLCDTRDDAVRQIANVLGQIADANDKTPPYRLAVYPSEIVRDVSSKLNLENWTLDSAPEDQAVDPKDYEKISASLISPLALLSDTGSCVAEGRTAFERLLFYLSPACLVVARASQLRENMPHAWSEIAAKLTPNQHGEIAIITGPSRTADIEKKLVLGVHGPQRLIVFIIKDE